MAIGVVDILLALATASLFLYITSIVRMLFLASDMDRKMRATQDDMVALKGGRYLFRTTAYKTEWIDIVATIDDNVKEMRGWNDEWIDHQNLMITSYALFLISIFLCGPDLVTMLFVTIIITVFLVIAMKAKAKVKKVDAYIDKELKWKSANETVNDRCADEKGESKRKRSRRWRRTV